VTYALLAERLLKVGLLARGGFHPQTEDAAPPTCRTVILVGNAGPEFWGHFQAGRRSEPNPLDAWTRREVNRIAASASGWAVYPSDGPPYFPFQKWAQKADSVFPSPIGMLIHPHYGLWHAYRAAICLHDAIPVPARMVAGNPCDTCHDQPCLTTCPVGAFSTSGYDVARCAAHIDTPEGTDCLEKGCRARRACPISDEALYAPGQAEFHMTAFQNARHAEKNR
jgi:hypothetical protein